MKARLHSRKGKVKVNYMRAIHIEWDTDEDMELLKELPTEMKLPEGMTDEDEISDWITEQEGFCNKGFLLED